VIETPENNFIFVFSFLIESFDEISPMNNSVAPLLTSYTTIKPIHLDMVL
jgi:hypothetical protein